MHKSLPFRAFEPIRVATAFLLIGAAAIAFSRASLAAVFGSDDRTRITVADQQLKDKIGTLVATDTGAFCTAFCVAPDMIATASHCLFGTEAAPAPKLNRLLFRLAGASASSARLALSRPEMQLRNLISGTKRLATEPPIGAANDWAVATLDHPACTSGGLHLSARTPEAIKAAAARGEVYQIASHADLPDRRLRRAAPCAMQDAFAAANRAAITRDFASPAAILFHTCDTGGGSSGSPLLVDTSDGPEVVAVNVGTYVLSRAVPTAQDARSHTVSEPIANTAIEISAIRNAVDVLRQRRMQQP